MYLASEKYAHIGPVLTLVLFICVDLAMLLSSAVFLCWSLRCSGGLYGVFRRMS